MVQGSAESSSGSGRGRVRPFASDRPRGCYRNGSPALFLSPFFSRRGSSARLHRAHCSGRSWREHSRVQCSYESASTRSGHRPRGRADSDGRRGRQGLGFQWTRVVFTICVFSRLPIHTALVGKPPIPTTGDSSQGQR